jgi:radical SAM/Cys-rich protein
MPVKESAFHTKVLSRGQAPLRAIDISTLQVNIGYRCNLACKHCHVGGGPARTEMMDRETLDAVLRSLKSGGIPTLDITGGAPELHPHFRDLVGRARAAGKRVIARTNLTVFFEEGLQDLPEFYRDHGVDLVASLPYYREENVDRVRGNGTFTKCIAALRKLNSLGYVSTGDRVLNLVYNPPGAFLAPDQSALEAEYRKELDDRFGISFTKLFTFTNMPIGRFRDFLARTRNLDAYLNRLAGAFNPATLDNIMCRHMVSVRWDGRLFDCDFNQVLDMDMDPSAPAHIRDFDLSALARRAIAVDDHCFGCTAGQGST